MSFEFYKILHLAAIMWLFMALGGYVFNALTGGTKTSKGAKRFMAIGHGVAALLILVAGFGMLAKMGVSHADGGWGVWVWGKLAIWVVLGGSIVMLKRMPTLARLIWPILIILGGVATMLAITKP